MANFNLWSSLPNFFLTPSGPVNGQYWAISNAGDGGAPIWVDTYSPAATYSPGAAETFTIAMTTQDWVGTEQPLVTIATVTNIVDPFGASSTGFGNLASAEISSNNSTTGFGGVIYWQNSTTVAGDYALEFVPITETFPTTPTTGPSTVVSGAPVTIDAAIANPTNWNFNVETSGIVLGYSTSASSSTENIYFQGFSTSGSPDTAPVEVLAGVPDSTQWFVGYANGTYYYRYTVANGSASGLYGGTFNPTTGAVGASSELTSLPSFTSITALTSRNALSNGDSMRFFEGVSSGQDILEAIYNNTTVSAAYFLTSTNDRIAYADVYDPGNGQVDYTVLAYTDNNQVHLELLNAVGNQIGSDFIVPGITQFDRIHTLTGDSNNSDTRVELDYTVTDPNGGTEIEGLIYDTATGPYVYTVGEAGNNEYGGSPFNDTISWAAGVYFVDGGGGSDTFSATTLSASQVTISVDPAGDVVVNDGKGDIDTLQRFTTIDLSNATVTISGNTLTETYGDGSRSVSTFNIPGQAYTSDVVSYAANGQIASVFFNGVTGDGYLSSYGYLYAGNSLVGTESIYSGNPSFSHEELDYNGAGQFVRGVFSGLSSSSPFSSFVETLVGGVYAGVSLIYTNVPAGTPYSSYDVNYSFTGTLAGVDLFYTNLSGIGYTNLEEDLDPSGNIVRLVATGYTSGALYKTEYDYSGGVYEGDKTYYNITGQAYTQLEVDESASGQTEKVVYSGFSSGISSSELDYTNGVVTQGVVAYANVTGQNYNAFQVVENTAGTPLSDVLDLNSGGHMQTAFASGQTLTSQGDDTFTGDGATTFVLNPIYGSDTITNLNSADTVNLSSTEFANSSVLLGDASASGTSVIIKAADGDTLTLDNQTIASFTALSNNFVIH